MTARGALCLAGGIVGLGLGLLLPFLANELGGREAPPLPLSGGPATPVKQISPIATSAAQANSNTKTSNQVALGPESPQGDLPRTSIDLPSYSLGLSEGETQTLRALEEPLIARLEFVAKEIEALRSQLFREKAKAGQLTPGGSYKFVHSGNHKFVIVYSEHPVLHQVTQEERKLREAMHSEIRELLKTTGEK